MNSVPISQAAEFDRILLNLLSNTFKFTPAGGKIRCDLGLLPGGCKRAHPYLYSEEELRRLLTGAKSYPSWNRFPGSWWKRFQVQTFYCLFGLLAVTGMRVGEALKLRPGDIDWSAGVLTIHNAKFG